MLSKTMIRTRWWFAAVCALLFALTAAPASADQWNERTILKFTEPVMVPGATLQPGTYVFRLLPSQSSRHLVEISKQDSGENIALIQAVPMKRMDAKGDTVLKFNPTDAGSPPALKGWFYPGSLYGHEFVYSDEEARKIAERTKTIVLSTDIPGKDFEKGTLRTYDASGMTKNWVPDSAAAASWEAWQGKRRATATAVTETKTGERARATAPMVESNLQAMRVKLDDLEDDPKKYIGKTVSVDAEVEEVYGPRVFKIDERNWGDLEGELLVYVPTHLAAIVRDDDRVTVTGTIKQFVKAEFENEWGWLDLDDRAELKLSKRPVIVASRIVGGDNQTALVLNVSDRQATERSGTAGTATTARDTTGTAGARERETAGTTGTGTAAAPLTDLTAVARADNSVVGRHVDLDRVTIHKVGAHHGLFATAGGRTVFILPMAGKGSNVTAGSTISLEGVVLQMPKFMEDRVASEAGDKSLNKAIYIYATTIDR